MNIHPQKISPPAGRPAPPPGGAPFRAARTAPPRPAAGHAPTPAVPKFGPPGAPCMHAQLCAGYAYFCFPHGLYTALRHICPMPAASATPAASPCRPLPSRVKRTPCGRRASDRPAQAPLENRARAVCLPRPAEPCAGGTRTSPVRLSRRVPSELSAEGSRALSARFACRACRLF